MDGSFVVEAGSIYDFLALVLSNDRDPRPSWLAAFLPRFRYLTRRMRMVNTKNRARDNASHHYDIDHRLYSLFLDEDLQYSCAYFETPEIGLDEAQMRKKHHLAAKASIAARNERARHRFGLWRTGPLPRRNVRGDGDGRDPLDRATGGRGEAGGRARIGSEGPFPVAGLSGRARPFRPDHLGRHVRACRPRFLRALFQAVLRSPQPRRRPCPPYGRPDSRAGAHQLLGGEVHISRRRQSGSCRRWRRSSKNPDSCFRISRFFACTMRTRCGPGGNGFSPIARRRKRSTTSGSAGCGSSISPRFEASFRFDDLVVFQFQLAKRLDTVPRTRNYLYS